MQAEVGSHIDALSQELSEVWKEVGDWTTEQKQLADAVTRNGQRMLENEKGARSPGPPSHALPCPRPAHAPAAVQRTFKESATCYPR